MIGIYVFVVVFFWVFVAAMVCVVVAASRDEIDWVETLFSGTQGAIYLASAAGFVAAMMRLVWLGHVALFGGAG